MTRYCGDMIVHRFREETGLMTGDQDAYRMNLNQLLAAITEVRYKYTPRMRDLIRLEKKKRSRNSYANNMLTLEQIS